MNSYLAMLRTALSDTVAFLNTFFQTSDQIENELSSSWRLNANRRTLFIITVVGAVAITSYLSLVRPPDQFPLRQLVTIPSGASVLEIAHALKEQKVIRSETAFIITTVALGREKSLRAGDYLFKEPKDVFSVSRTIALGAFGLEPIKIRIPEGATTRSMAIIYKSELERFNPERFLEVAQPLEGFLFPDTYHFLPNANEDTVIQAMRDAFDRKIAELTPPVASSTLSLPELITLASIIEREASNPADRRMISGVLYNRLAKKMPLQVDVTFLYIMGKNSFQLTREDLRSDNPYNTYVHVGLPPGPIGSPSLDSIDAALNPTKNPYLFYLADYSGVTHFSKTYEEHLVKKRRYLD